MVATLAAAVGLVSHTSSKGETTHTAEMFAQSGDDLAASGALDEHNWSLSTVMDQSRDNFSATLHGISRFSFNFAKRMKKLSSVA